MNWAAWGPTIVSAITMIFVAGKTYGRINDQEKTLKRHDDELEIHGGKINMLELASERTKAWREGVAFGSKTNQTH